MYMYKDMYYITYPDMNSLSTVAYTHLLDIEWQTVIIR